MSVVLASPNDASIADSRVRASALRVKRDALRAKDLADVSVQNQKTGLGDEKATRASAIVGNQVRCPAKIQVCLHSYVLVSKELLRYSVRIMFVVANPVRIGGRTLIDSPKVSLR